MRAYIGYSTAVQYWLKNGMDETNRANVVSFRSLNDAAYTLQELTSLDLQLHGLEASMARGWPDSRRKRGKTKREVPQGEAIHVLVPKGADSNRIEGFDRHVWSTHIPENSFCEIASDTYVSTPEFAFLQMAGALTFAQTVLVGYWLCASYKLPEGGGVPLEVEPPTSVERLQTFLLGAEGCYGAKKARRALRWVIDGARSPMEVATSMVMSLPTKYGGYGLEKPCINYKVETTDWDSCTLDRPDRTYFEIDLYWPKKKVGVEYDGFPHLDPARIRKDKRRLNCLLVNDIKVLVVMYDQMVDDDVRDTLMHQLSKMLGAKQRDVSDAEKDAREALKGLLFLNEFSL